MEKSKAAFLERLFLFLIDYYFFFTGGLAGTGGFPVGFATLAEAVGVLVIVFAVVLLIFVYVVYVIFVKMFFNFYLIGHAPPAHSAISSISTFPDMMVIKGLTLALAAKYASSSIS